MLAEHLLTCNSDILRGSGLVLLCVHRDCVDCWSLYFVRLSLCSLFGSRSRIERG